MRRTPVPSCSLRRRGRLAAVAVAGVVLLPGALPAQAAQGTSAAERSATAGTLPVRGLDLDAATIPQLQERMDDGDLTSVDLTAAYLERIDALNTDLGALLAVNPDALADAAASDDVRDDDGARSALEGIPVLLKDNVDTADMPTTAGSRAMLGNEPDDAEITRRLRAAGAVVIGKANLSEWANFRGDGSTSGWSGVGGQTANPYVLDRNPCGSSSGSGTGVAASLAQVSIGTETDGSIVCPAGTTGLVGLKPTLGLVSRDGIIPISAEQDTAGPMARHSVDAALLLEVIAGEDDADAATQEIPEGLDTGFAEALDAEALDGARVGVWTLSAEESAAVEDDAEAVYAAAVASIQAAGATAVPLQLAYQPEIGEAEFPALVSEFRRDLTAYLEGSPGDHPKDLAGLIEFNAADPVELAYFGQELLEQSAVAPLPAEDDAVQGLRDTARELARASIDEALAQGPGEEDDLDAVVALTNTPGWKTRYLSTDGEADQFRYGSSSPAAVAGYPNATVPAGFAGPQGALPVGISFIGGQWDDAQVLSLAHAFEAETRARRAPGYLPTLGE